MSQTYIAIIVGALAFYLPKWGVIIGTDELTSVVQSVVLTVSGIWVLIRRYRLGKEIKSDGDISVFGVRQ